MNHTYYYVILLCLPDPLVCHLQLGCHSIIFIWWVYAILTVYVDYQMHSTGILALIIVRTLRRDIARYNRDEEFVSKSVNLY